VTYPCEGPQDPDFPRGLVLRYGFGFVTITVACRFRKLGDGLQSVARCFWVRATLRGGSACDRDWKPELSHLTRIGRRAKSCATLRGRSDRLAPWPVPDQEHCQLPHRSLKKRQRMRKGGVKGTGSSDKAAPLMIQEDRGRVAWMPGHPALTLFKMLQLPHAVHHQF